MVGPFFLHQPSVAITLAPYVNHLFVSFLNYSENLQ